MLINSMRKTILIMIATATIALAASNPIALWPKTAPGEKGDIGEEVDTTKPDAPPKLGKRVMRIGNVSTPTMTIFRAPKDKDTGASVLVFPGGGYSILAYDLEGSEICEWLNSIGVTGILVKYRVPARKGLEKHTAALQDAQRAVGMVRQRAEEWKLDPKRIGVLGFSAGGHLAAAISTNYEKRTYDTVDAADALSCRPDFTVLVYPAYLAAKEQNFKIAPELPVTANTPPTILIQAEDDKSFIDGTVSYFIALKNAKVPASMHLYPTGGHGYGLRPSEATVSSWPKRVEEWMRAAGTLRPGS